MKIEIIFLVCALVIITIALIDKRISRAIKARQKEMKIKMLEKDYNEYYDDLIKFTDNLIIDGTINKEMRGSFISKMIIREFKKEKYD